MGVDEVQFLVETEPGFCDASVGVGDRVARTQHKHFLLRTQKILHYRL